MVSFLSCSGVMNASLASGWFSGKAAMKVSSYSGAMAKPDSGKGSARMAQSSSPVRSISSSRTVKFSCSISGICGTSVMIWRTKSGSKYGPMV